MNRTKQGEEEALPLQYEYGHNFTIITEHKPLTDNPRRVSQMEIILVSKTSICIIVPVKPDGVNVLHDLI